MEAGSIIRAQRSGMESYYFVFSRKPAKYKENGRRQHMVSGYQCVSQLLLWPHWLSHTYKDDSSSGVVVSEGGGIFFGALQNPRPNFLVLDVFEVLDAMAPPMLEELAVLDGSHMGFPS